VIDPTKGLAASGIVTAPTFAFAAADVARAGALRRDLARLPTASRRVDDEGQSTSTTWIDFRGPPGTVRPVSALDLLEGRVARGAFRNKVVVVGLTAPHAQLRKGVPRDVHRTPLDRGAGMSGPEVQANALDTMLRGAPLRDVSQLIDILAILALACIPAMAGLIRSRALGAAAIAAAALLYIAGVQLAFHRGWILGVVVPLAALAASALAVATLAAIQAARRQRRVRGEPVERTVTTLTL
jgi:CHASE2 domain-containing sensor protein